MMSVQFHNNPQMVLMVICRSRTSITGSASPSPHCS